MAPTFPPKLSFFQPFIMSRDSCSLIYILTTVRLSLKSLSSLSLSLKTSLCLSVSQNLCLDKPLPHRSLSLNKPLSLTALTALSHRHRSLLSLSHRRRSLLSFSPSPLSALFLTVTALSLSARLLSLSLSLSRTSLLSLSHQ
ncbi:hypothetical protein Syun_019028 [Stephania yunnanensis]|uniref:Uncharacterized protein n=1 Tax=Stephania yunnanensis TaxID=152371 RepID=A0AAP0IVP9_9MAGN